MSRVKRECSEGWQREDKMTGSAHLLIKQVMVTEEGSKWCREDGRLLLDVETEDKLADRVPVYKPTEEVIIVIAERLLFVPESIFFICS